jgi:hypothetical protein
MSGLDILIGVTDFEYSLKSLYVRWRWWEGAKLKCTMHDFELMGAKFARR